MIYKWKCDAMHPLENNGHITVLSAFLVIMLGVIAERSESNSYLAIAIVIGGIYSVCCKTSELFMFLLLLIASNRLLTIGEAISMPFVIMIIGCIRMILNERMALRIPFIIGAILLIMESFLSYIFINNYISVFLSIKILIMLYFIQSYTDTIDIKKTYIRLVDACATGCIMTVTLTVIINPSSIFENYRFSLTGQGGENVLGILCSIMALNLLCIALYKNIKNRKKYLMYIVMLILIALLTGSRSALLSFLIGFVSIYLMACIRFGFRQVFMLFVFATIVVIVLNFILVGDSVLSVYTERFIYRMQKLQSTDISNGRFGLWISYFNVFYENTVIFLLGGMDYMLYGIKQAAHNMIIEQVASHGILGTFIISLLYFSVYRYVKKRSHSKIRWFSTGVGPLLSLFVVSMFSHSIFGIPQTTMLFISAYGILEELA